MKKAAGELIRGSFEYFFDWRNFANSRKQARNFREQVIAHNGRSYVTHQMISSMKREMKKRFGDSGHWPWIALYAELRGEYIKGWIPDDFYVHNMLPRYNPQPGAKLSTVKSYDHRLFQGFAIEPILLKINGIWFDSDMSKTDPQRVFNDLKGETQEVVIKRDGSPSGLEIDFVKTTDLSLDHFLAQKNYLIQPSVRQHKNLESLYDKSVNTLRITTFIKESGEIVIKHRSLRFGTGGKRIVNVSKGGLCFILDNNGKVSSRALNDLGLEKGEMHPDTGYIFSNLQVPSVAEAEKRCREAHLSFPYSRFIAWDLYIDENGKPGLIEWNAVRPDMWVNEALIGPLWSEDEVNEVLRARG